MGCRLSSQSNSAHVQQAIRRKSSHLVTLGDIDQTAYPPLPRTFVPAEACQLLHDSIEKRNEEAVIRILYNYKDEDYNVLLEQFMEEYCIDPVTLAFQNLSSGISEFVRLRLNSSTSSVSHFLNYHLRDKTTGFQNKILGVLLGYQEMDLRALTRDYFYRYGFTLSNHLYGGFEGEILDFLQDMLNRNTDSQVLEENMQQELEMSVSGGSLSSPTIHRIMVINKKAGSVVSVSGDPIRRDGIRFSNGSLVISGVETNSNKMTNNNGLAGSGPVPTTNTTTNTTTNNTTTNTNTTTNNNNNKDLGKATETTVTTTTTTTTTTAVSVKPVKDFQFVCPDLEKMSVVDCVTKLHESSISAQLVDGDQLIFKMLATLSRQTLRDIFVAYFQKYQRDIVVDIENCVPPSYLRDLLVLSIQILRNDSMFFSKEINLLLKSTDEESAKNYYLMFYVMTRNKDAIADIKKAYRNHYFESLSDDIRSLVTDPLLQSALIKALARVSSSGT